MVNLLNLDWRKALATVCIAVVMSSLGVQAHAFASQVGHGLAPPHGHDALHHHDDHHEDRVAVADAQSEDAIGPSGAEDIPAGPVPVGHHHHTDTVAGLAAVSPDLDYPTAAALTRLLVAANDRPPGWLPLGADEPPRPLTVSA